MNKKKSAVIIGVISAILLTVFALFTASAYTDSDPLITLSYLEQIFAPNLKQQIIDEAALQSVPAASESTTPAENVDTLTASSASSSYTLLELTHGQTVLANSICEFIVRPGSKVAAYSPFPAQGIADITNGIEVLGGEMISINAYCLVPRGNDGRGFTVVGEKAYVMIRGEYTIG